MKISLAKPSKRIAHLGPVGTNAETAALAYVNWLSLETNFECTLCPYSTISQALEASAVGQVDCSVVPVENSIEGSVTVTLDTLWRLDRLRIQHALVCQFPTRWCLMLKILTRFKKFTLTRKP